MRIIGAALVGLAPLVCAAQAADDGTGSEGVASAPLVELGGAVFFVASDGDRGYGSSPGHFAQAGGQPVFAASGQAWRSDGSASGTVALQDTRAAEPWCNPKQFLRIFELR